MQVPNGNSPRQFGAFTIVTGVTYSHFSAMCGKKRQKAVKNQRANPSLTKTLRPSPDFRPAPNRAVYILGAITQETVEKLTPEILKMQAAAREPITLYVDSPGGETRSADALVRLLRTGTQDDPSPCRLITVVTTTAASAAADLLASGDYALAYPHSKILCHGVRQGADVLTREQAMLLAQTLASSNEGFALELARNCIYRFIFRFVFLQEEFDAIRQRENDFSLSPSRCMTFALQNRVSAPLHNLLWSSFNQSGELDILDAYVSKNLQAHDLSFLPPPEFEVLVLKGILDHELENLKARNYPPWSLTQRFGDIEEKLQLLVDKHGHHHTHMIRALCERWGNFFLTDGETQEYESKADEDKEEWLLGTVQERLRPLWSFFVSLCRQLQKQDHWLSSQDAYWLGLIDEVIGRDDLSNLRTIVENAPD
jgi:ATP-dependent protease ClpP protease subunit